MLIRCASGSLFALVQVGDEPARIPGDMTFCGRKLIYAISPFYSAATLHYSALTRRSATHERLLIEPVVLFA